MLVFLFSKTRFFILFYGFFLSQLVMHVCDVPRGMTESTTFLYFSLEFCGELCADEGMNTVRLWRCFRWKTTVTRRSSIIPHEIPRPAPPLNRPLINAHIRSPLAPKTSGNLSIQNLLRVFVVILDGGFCLRRRPRPFIWDSSGSVTGSLADWCKCKWFSPFSCNSFVFQPHRLLAAAGCFAVLSGFFLLFCFCCFFTPAFVLFIFFCVYCNYARTECLYKRSQCMQRQRAISSTQI